MSGKAIIAPKTKFKTAFKSHVETSRGRNGGRSRPQATFHTLMTDRILTIQKLFRNYNFEFTTIYKADWPGE